MISVETPGSPGWHLYRLAKRLAERRPELQVLDDYYQGRPPLPQGTENMAPVFQRFQRKARLNYAEMITEALRERVRLLDFRTAATGDAAGDAVARLMMTENELDVESAEVHRMMFALGDGYVIVGAPDETSGIPVITAEDPRQVITSHDPARQRIVTAGLKLYHDPDAELDVALLSLPVAGQNARAWRATKRAVSPSLGLRFASQAWSWDEEYGGAGGTELDVRRPPFVRFRNKRGVGEYETHLDHLDRINFWLFQLMIIAIHQAHRQRAVKGTFPEVDAAGEPIDYNALFSSDPGAMWHVPADAEFWESVQADLSGIGNELERDIKRLAAVTRTPLFYMTSDAADGSAEGASLSREALTFRAEDRIPRAVAAWRAVASLGFEWMGDMQRANYAAIEPIMASPERHSLAERADAATKAKAADVPWVTRMTDIMQYSPAQVQRMRGERAEDAAAPDLQDIPPGVLTD